MTQIGVKNVHINVEIEWKDCKKFQKHFNDCCDSLQSFSTIAVKIDISQEKCRKKLGFSSTFAV